MTKSQTFHSIRRDTPTILRRLHLLARSFARIALLASLLLVGPVENLSARDVRAEVEKHNASIQETERERKYKAMCLTPFTFYRATAHLFYQDIAEKRLKIPPEWDARKGLRTWISGDFHLQNVGFEDPGSGELCFELNDFDESCQAPFYWDLIRLVASVYLVKDSKDWPLESKDDKKEQMKVLLSDKEADEVTMNFLKAYQDTIAANAIPALTASELGDPTDKGKAKAAQGFVRTQLSPEDKERKEKQDEFWDKETGGTKTRFNLTDKERFAEIKTAIAEQIAAHWDEYIGSLKPGSARSFRAGYFKPIHMAQRLGSGLGSLGVMKVYILIEGEADTTKDDNVVLEAKATSTPAEVKTGALSAPQLTGGEAKRVSDATRAMTARTDDHEGWFNADGVSYHVTRISPLGDGVKLKDFEKREQFEDYLQWSAVALANAHCRANPRFASEALRAFRDFKEVKDTIRDIGRDYVAQISEDYDAFRKK